MLWRVSPQTVVELRSADPLVTAALRRIFATHLADSSAEIAPSFTLECHLVPRLPALPAAPPYFVDTRLGPIDSFGNLAVYATDRPNERLLHYFDGAVARVCWEPDAPQATLWLTEQMVQSPRFEDAVFTTVAPLLRRVGLFMVHAFAAVSPAGHAVLLVGQSGSGKTTTGLNLLLNGWHLLANDVVLLAAGDDAKDVDVIAWPTPGVVSIRRPSFALLPRLQKLTGGRVPTHDLPVDGVHINRWATGAFPVRAIAFPRIAHTSQSALEPLHQGIALAHLLEESLDVWDEPLLSGHTAVLQQLVTQARPSILHLGTDMGQLAQLVGELG